LPFKNERVLVGRNIFLPTDTRIWLVVSPIIVNDWRNLGTFTYSNIPNLVKVGRKLKKSMMASAHKRIKRYLRSFLALGTPEKRINFEQKKTARKGSIALANYYLSRQQ
jgi:hypothetical protein